MNIRISWYEADSGREITPQEVYADVMALRRCQNYIPLIESEQAKADFERVLCLAFDLVCETLDEHGVETLTQKEQFEAGNFTSWR